MSASIVVPEPYFVTPHAIDRYRERIDTRAGWHDAVREINKALQGSGPEGGYPFSRTIALGVPRRFVAFVEPPGEHGPWPAVVTILKWSTDGQLLTRRGSAAVGYRYYRWQKGARWKKAYMDKVT